MTKMMIAAVLAGAISVSACSTYGTGGASSAATTPVSEAAVKGVAPGASVAEGALAGAAISGLTNAVWADSNNDGYVDGYVQNGTYYAGVPRGYDSAQREVVAEGSTSGAMTMPIAIPVGAAAGVPVAGMPGAIWSDNNGDGQIDGYVYNGQYFPGAPQTAPTSAMTPPMATTPSATAPMPSNSPASPAPARGERG